MYVETGAERRRRRTSPRSRSCVYNKSAWPARALTNASFRYYFTLETASRASQVTVTFSLQPVRRRPATHRPALAAARTTSRSPARADDRAGRASRSGGGRCSSASPYPQGVTWNNANDPSLPGRRMGLNNAMTLYDSGGTLRLRQRRRPARRPTPPRRPRRAPRRRRPSRATGATLSWTASTDTGGSGLAGYDVINATNAVVATSTTNSVDADRADRRHGVHAAGARPGRRRATCPPPSTAVTFTTLTATDTTAPTTPGTPTASAITSTGATLSWAASTDTGGSGLAGYNVYREAGTTDVLAGSPTTNSFALTGLTAVDAVPVLRAGP